MISGSSENHVEEAGIEDLKELGWFYLDPIGMRIERASNLDPIPGRLKKCLITEHSWEGHYERTQH